MSAGPDDTTRKQHRASDPGGSAWVSANAGSGKTHVLVQRVLRLLLDGKPYANADVTVIRGGNRYRYKMGELALKTDADGVIAVTWPEAGRYWLGASHGGRPAGPQGGNVSAAPEGPPQGGTLAAPARRESYSATFEVLPR